MGKISCIKESCALIGASSFPKRERERERERERGGKYANEDEADTGAASGT